MVEKLCIGAASLGGSLLALSLLWGYLFPPQNTWTVEKASRMSELSNQAHTLHIQVNQAKRNPSAGGDQEPGDVHQRYREVTVELAALKSELEAAKQAPQTISKLLRWSGMIVLICALVGLRFLRSA